jgi:hypothetical protein
MPQWSVEINEITAPPAEGSGVSIKISKDAKGKSWVVNAPANPPAIHEYSDISDEEDVVSGEESESEDDSPEKTSILDEDLLDFEADEEDLALTATMCPEDQDKLLAPSPTDKLMSESDSKGTTKFKFKRILFDSDAGTSGVQSKGPKRDLSETAQTRKQKKKAKVDIDMDLELDSATLAAAEAEIRKWSPGQFENLSAKLAKESEKQRRPRKKK